VWFIWSGMAAPSAMMSTPSPARATGPHDRRAMAAAPYPVVIARNSPAIIA